MSQKPILDLNTWRILYISIIGSVFGSLFANIFFSQNILTFLCGIISLVQYHY